MARIRTIKPAFWASEDVAAVCRDARLLFIGLWNFADDSGNGPASPKGLIMKVFPGDSDVTTAMMEKWLGDLDRDLIGLYEAKGKQYYHVMKWDHQRIDKPQKALYPPFVERSWNVPRSFPPDSIGRDRIVREGIVKDSKGEELVATDVPATYIELSRSFLEKQKEAFSKESAWKDFEGRVTDGAKKLYLFHTQNDWTEDEIRDLLLWVVADDFWSRQIRTLGGIRKPGDNKAMKFENARASKPMGLPAVDEAQVARDSDHQRTADAEAEFNLNDPETLVARGKALASVKGLAGKMGA